MECWAVRLGSREAVAEFSATDLGFQGVFSTGLGAELRFCLYSIFPFHIGDHIVVRTMCISCYQQLKPSTDRSMSNWSRQ
jgi:hypothetical protein